jgi:hypothetical protein
LTIDLTNRPIRASLSLGQGDEKTTDAAGVVGGLIYASSDPPHKIFASDKYIPSFTAEVAMRWGLVLGKPKIPTITTIYQIGSTGHLSAIRYAVITNGKAKSAQAQPELCRHSHSHLQSRSSGGSGATKAILRLEMVGKAHCERNYDQGWHVIAAGRKDRTAGNVQIVHAMHPAIPVDDALPRCVRFSRSPMRQSRWARWKTRRSRFGERVTRLSRSGAGSTTVSIWKWSDFAASRAVRLTR